MNWRPWAPVVMVVTLAVMLLGAIVGTVMGIGWLSNFLLGLGFVLLIGAYGAETFVRWSRRHR